jgi:hypothetical protein
MVFVANVAVEANDTAALRLEIPTPRPMEIAVMAAAARRNCMNRLDAMVAVCRIVWLWL